MSSSGKVLINQNTLVNFIAGDLESDIEVFQNLFTIFKNYLNEFVQFKYDESEASIENLRGLAHKIKSSSASYGAEALRSLLIDLETACKAKDRIQINRYYNEALGLVRESEVEIKRVAERLFSGELKSA